MILINTTKWDINNIYDEYMIHNVILKRVNSVLHNNTISKHY